MRGKLLLMVGLAVSIAAVGLGPRGHAPPLVVQLAGKRLVLRLIPARSARFTMAERRPLAPRLCAAPQLVVPPPPVPTADPRHWFARPSQPLVRDLLLRYP